MQTSYYWDHPEEREQLLKKLLNEEELSSDKNGTITIKNIRKKRFLKTIARNIGRNTAQMLGITAPMTVSNIITTVVNNKMKESILEEHRQ